MTVSMGGLVVRSAFAGPSGGLVVRSASASRRVRLVAGASLGAASYVRDVLP